MASYVPAKYGTEYIFYVGLESVATAGTFQANPTLASGDFKLAKNGGTLANLTTLPTVTPASGKLVKITLSATEMECDNAAVVCSDASGNEWRDLIINIQTAARQIDDLAYGTVSANVVQISGDTTAADNAESFFDGTGYAGTGNVIPTVTAAGLADGAITAAKIAADAITAAKLAADVTTEIQSGLLTSTAFDTKIGTPAGASLAADVAAVKSDTAATLTDTAEIGTAGAGLTALASAANLATLAGYVDTEVAAIKAVTDNLPNSGALTTITNNVASILADTGTDGVVVDSGSKTGYSLATDQSGVTVGTVNALGTTAKADVNAEVVDALNVDTYAEPSSVPAATSSLAVKIRWLFALARNKMTQTSTTQALRNDADSANIATSTVSDDGSVMTRGEWS